MSDESSVARAIRIASDEAGGQAALASAVGVVGPSPRAVVWAWINRGSVPPEYCQAIKRIGGARVALWDLRPDDWHRIWPELIAVEGAPEVPLPPNAAEPQPQEAA